MTKRTWVALSLLLTAAILLTALPDAAGRQEFQKKQKGKGPGGPGGPKMGFGGPGGGIRKLVKQFDKDGDGRLNRKERDAAREFLKKERAQGGGPGGFRGPGGP